MHLFSTVAITEGTVAVTAGTIAMTTHQCSSVWTSVGSGPLILLDDERKAAARGWCHKWRRRGQCRLSARVAATGVDGGDDGSGWHGRSSMAAESG
ncbi:hypothetical protein ACLOJK_022514 [Asimina triloba]